ncbi:MAG: hypothetical protein ACI84C_001805 [Flavobacteriales bacterium]
MKDEILGTWRQIQDTTITLRISSDKWVFIKVDVNDTIFDHYNSTLHRRNQIGTGESKDLYQLVNPKDTIQLRIDGFKGPQMLYITDMQSETGFGYRRIKD